MLGLLDLQLSTDAPRIKPQLVNIWASDRGPPSEGQMRRNRQLMKDYKKFFGFRPCDMEDERNRPPPCNICPMRVLPPCRDKDSPQFNPKDKFAESKCHFRPCRPEGFEWPEFPPKW